MAKSWSWSLALRSEVDEQDTVDVPTPDYDEERADPDSVELAIGNVVVDVPEEATVEFDGENATVTNLTGEGWAAGDTLYVYVKSKTPTLNPLASWRRVSARWKARSTICRRVLQRLRPVLGVCPQRPTKRKAGDEKDRSEKSRRLDRRRRPLRPAWPRRRLG